MWFQISKFDKFLLFLQLLQYHPTERLGAGAGGVDDIKSHPFFSKVDWTRTDAAT